MKECDGTQSPLLCPHWKIGVVKEEEGEEKMEEEEEDDASMFTVSTLASEQGVRTCLCIEPAASEYPFTTTVMDEKGEQTFWHAFTVENRQFWV